MGKRRPKHKSVPNEIDDTLQIILPNELRKRTTATGEQVGIGGPKRGKRLTNKDEVVLIPEEVMGTHVTETVQARHRGPAHAQSVKRA
jgi:hypothetical protein